MSPLFRAYLPILSLAFYGFGCSPFVFFQPDSLSSENPLVVSVEKSIAPGVDVEVVVDDFGVPHFFGESENDLSFALGWMHARDRLFQVELLKHAAYGRLSEFFNRDLVDNDRRRRFSALGLQAQFDMLSGRDKQLLRRYADGVNAGAKKATKPLELVLLRRDVSTFEPIDSLAIMRMQAWDLSADFFEEIERLHIKERLSESDVRYPFFFSPMPSGGVPIVPTTEVATRLLPYFDLQNASNSTRPVLPKHNLFPNTTFSNESERGASNSWAVSGTHTASGNAVLCNDPHLAHSAPGIFYIVHLERPHSTLVGPTIPGLPAVLIGHTRHLAWAMTTSNADAQDLVELVEHPTDKNVYLVDGQPKPLQAHTEVFQRGRKPAETDLKEVWYDTEFGPVVPALLLDGLQKKYAFSWSGMQAIPQNSHIVSAFWDLGDAKNADEATRVVERISMSAQSMTFAFTDGTIAYRLATAVPRRSAQVLLTNQARLGKSLSDGWNGFLPQIEKPSLTNPASGYIIASNQRVVDDSHPLAKWVGTDGAEPSRALRIRELLEQFFKNGKVTTQQLADMQQDTVSVAARDVSPAFAKLCPTEIAGVNPEHLKLFCQRLASFNGEFSSTSKEALYYVSFRDAFLYEVHRANFDDVAAKRLADWVTLRALIELAVRTPGDTADGLFLVNGLSREENLKRFGAVATKMAMQRIESYKAEFSDPYNITWGQVHSLSFKGPLSTAPIIGRLFQTPPVEESGFNTAIRAEGGLPVKRGAVFRMVAEMTNPPQVMMVGDLGNSGYWGNRHFSDQNSLWHDGKFMKVETVKSEILKKAEGKILFKVQTAR